VLCGTTHTNCPLSCKLCHHCLWCRGLHASPICVHFCWPCSQSTQSVSVFRVMQELDKRYTTLHCQGRVLVLLQQLQMLLRLAQGTVPRCAVSVSCRIHSWLAGLLCSRACLEHICACVSERRVLDCMLVVSSLLRCVSLSRVLSHEHSWCGQKSVLVVHAERTIELCSRNAAHTLLQRP
jgi:hypothetical protein